MVDGAAERAGPPRRPGEQRRGLHRPPAADHLVRGLAGRVVAHPGGQPPSGRRTRPSGAVPHLVAAGGGAVVNVSSRGAFRGEPNNPAYGASKAGLNAFASVDGARARAARASPSALRGAGLRADRDGARGPRRAGRGRRPRPVAVRPGRSARGGRRGRAVARLARGAVLHRHRSSTSTAPPTCAPDPVASSPRPAPGPSCGAGDVDAVGRGSKPGSPAGRRCRRSPGGSPARRPRRRTDLQPVRRRRVEGDLSRSRPSAARARRGRPPGRRRPCRRPRSGRRRAAGRRAAAASPAR